MAKKLKATGGELGEGGLTLTFERLGERFECVIRVDECARLTTWALRTIALHGGVLRVPVEKIAFAEASERAGEPPTLALSGPNGGISLDLTWSAIAELSETATEMLRRSGASAGRPN